MEQQQELLLELLVVLDVDLGTGDDSAS